MGPIPVLLLIPVAAGGSPELLLGGLLLESGLTERALVGTLLPHDQAYPLRQEPLGRLSRGIVPLHRGRGSAKSVARQLERLTRAHGVKRVLACAGFRPALELGEPGLWQRIAAWRARHPELPFAWLVPGSGVELDILLDVGALGEDPVFRLGEHLDAAAPRPGRTDAVIGWGAIAIEGASRDAVATARRALCPEPGSITSSILVAFAGDLVPESRPEDFIALARRFEGEPTFRFVVCGAGPLLGETQRWVELFGLSRSLVVTEGIAMGVALAASDIVCAMAELEPAPWATLAALRLGRAVVASSASPLAELVARSGAGEVVEVRSLGSSAAPDPVDAYAAALRRVAKSAQRRRLGEQARAAAATLVPAEGQPLLAWLGKTPFAGKEGGP